MNWKDLLETVLFSRKYCRSGNIGCRVVCSRRLQEKLQARAGSLGLKFVREVFEKNDLKFMRDALDCSVDSDEVNQTVIGEDPRFTDYLNFFEYIAFLKDSKQLQVSEVEGLFGYYLDCLKRHQSVRTYIENPEKGFEGLAKLIEVRK